MSFVPPRSRGDGGSDDHDADGLKCVLLRLDESDFASTPHVVLASLNYESTIDERRLLHAGTRKSFRLRF